MELYLDEFNSHDGKIKYHIVKRFFFLFLLCGHQFFLVFENLDNERQNFVTKIKEHKNRKV